MRVELLESGADGPTALPTTPEDLCLLFAARVSKFANLVARDTFEAQDIAQEALLKAIRALKSYKAGEGSIESWLWRIVTNTSNDFSRSRMRRLRLVRRLGSLSPPEFPQPEQEALIQLTSRDLRTALRRLSDRDRTLLAMRFGADMAIRQIAECMNLSTDAADKALQRAMQRLKAEFQEFRDA